MKKTLTVNLNGRVFNIDEDAYELLEDYLSNLKSYFGKKSDAAEILSDFEARIEELFSEKIKLGHEVITIEQVEAVIKCMGNPEDLGDETVGTEKENATSDGQKENKSKKKFYRNVDDKKLGGVCSGIAAYFGWDPLPVRLAFVVLTLLSTGWGIIFYLILWILMPAALTASQKLEMKGEAVTLENIGKTVSETISSVKTNEVGSFLSAILKICAIVFGFIIGFPLLIVFFILFVGAIAMMLGIGSPFFGLDFRMFMDGLYGLYPLIGMIPMIIVSIILLFSIIYFLFYSNGKKSSLSKKTKWIVFLIWMIVFVTLMLFGVKFAKQLTNCSRHGTITNETITITEWGGQIERSEDLPDFEILELNDNLIADVRIRQEIGENPKIVITGNENFVTKIAWKIEDKKLELYVKEGYIFKNVRNLTIFITTPEIKGVVLNSFGKVVMENKIESSDFDVRIDGAGSFYSDSLYCSSVSCKLNGAGKITVAGEAANVQLFVSGVGKIDAKNLEAHSVLANLEGVGSIKCNPVESLDASVDGVGKITYKNEPKNIKTLFNGVGKIEQD